MEYELINPSDPYTFIAADFETALQAITDKIKKEEFIAAWQDGRSSLNNIGERARRLSKQL